MNYTVHKNVADLPVSGWLTRQSKAASRVADARSDKTLALTRVRAAMRDLDDAKELARAEFDRLNALVANPLPGRLHRDVALLVDRALANAGIVDVTKPLTAGPTITDIEANVTRDARQALADAEAALVRIEAQEARFEAIVAAGAGALDIEPVDDEGDESVLDDLPKRGRGRPRLSDDD